MGYSMLMRGNDGGLRSDRDISKNLQWIDVFVLNRECEPGAQGAALVCAFPWTIC